MSERWQVMLNPRGRLSDEEFLTRFIADYSALEKLGWSKGQILHALCRTQDYIRDWAMTPGWLEIVGKLPKGAKWQDGMKFQQKASQKSGSETYVLLAFHGDMYFKDLLNHMTATAITDANGKPVPKWEMAITDGLKTHYLKKTDHTICVIRDFRKIPSSRVVMELRRGRVMTPLLETAILKAWQTNGGKIWPENCLKKI